MNFLRAFAALFAATIGLILALPVLVLALPLWLVSLLTRGTARLLEPRFLSHEQLIEFDPTFGWKPKPNLDTHHLMGDLFRIKTDRDGWRGSTTLQESDLVVLGDSFAAGYGVGEHQFFAHLCHKPLIKSIGAGGYSMVQELLCLEQLSAQLQGKLVVWFIYFGNDLYDNLSPDLQGYRKPFLRERKGGEDWEIVSSHVSSTQWPIATRVRLEGQHHLSKLAEICSESFLAERAYRACAHLLRAGQKICQEAGADLAIMTIPEASQLTPEGKALRAHRGELQSFDPLLPDKRLEAACRELDIPFLAGSTFLDLNCYMKNDCHWNARGHRTVARALANLHAEVRQTLSRRLPSDHPISIAAHHHHGAVHRPAH